MAEGGTCSDTDESLSIGNVNTQTPAEYRTLLVQGLTPAVCDQLLQLYFESPKYGGGDLECVRRENDGEARIVYKEHGSKITQ